MANEPSNLVPPYVSWGVFKTTIDNLAETVVPSAALDRRVLDGLSGADHGALMSGLRFLGLVDGQKIATPAYRELVQSSKDSAKFKSLLCGILEAKYKPILGHVNLQHGTIAELEKAFKESGVTQGQMLTKTIRFFVKAMGECGTPLSPYITKPSPKASRPAGPKSSNDKARIRGSKPSGGEQVHQQPPLTDTPPAGFGRLPIPGIENAFIQYPVGLTDAQCTLLEGAVAFLKVYVTGKIAGGGQKP